MKIIKILAFLLLVVTSCNSNDIEYVQIYFLPEGLTTQFPVNCENLDSYKAVLKDTIISDRDFIEALYNKISEFKVYAEKNKSAVEIRIRCELVRNDKSKLVLCCGEYFGILNNGERMIDDKSLIEMIKQKIYN